MKIKHLLIGMLAMAAAVACKPDDPVEEPSLNVDKTAVSLAATAAEATFNVTANNDWTATADADWVSLDPSSGKGAAKAVAVKVTAEDNEAAEARTATVTVKSGALTETVEVTQAGVEVVPPPTPNADWTSDKVVSYDLPEDASSSRQLLKNIKYIYDENYLYVKLQASSAEFEAAPAEYLGFFVYDVTDGTGDGYYGWWNDAKGNTEYEGEHIGVFSGTDLTLTVGETPVEVVKEVNGDELVWTLNILRSAHENLALENPHFAFLTYIGWEPNGALPDKYDDMLQFNPASAPELEVSDWALVGSFNGWNPAEGTTPLYVLNDEYFVVYGFELAEGAQFKFLKGGAWGNPEVGADRTSVEPNTIQAKGGTNILVSTPGTYDIYLAADAATFYIMSEGKTPAEATEPAAPEKTYTVTGTLQGANWDNMAPAGLMTKDGDYYVAKGVPFVTAATLYGGANQLEFKVCNTGSWDGAYGLTADASFAANAEISVTAGGEKNIAVAAAEGAYDVYFDEANAKVWVMEPGYKPGEKDPVQVEVTYTVTGTIKGTDADKKANYWNPSNEPGLMALEGDYYVAKNVEFDYDYRFSEDGTGEDFVKFKICETGTWNAYGQAEEAVNKPNTEIAVLKDGKDIYLNQSGVYDVYFDKTNGKVWVMEAGYKPGEEIARLDGYQWLGEFDDMPILFDLGIAEEGMLSIALPTMDESGFALHMVGFYEIEATDKSSGVISFTQYDWEWDEVGEEFEIQYSELTANSVKVVCENVFGVADPITLTRVENPYEIQLPGGGGGSPEGPIANGGYWFTNSGKVMAPMAEDVTSGMFPAKDLINYASTVKNTFTFTYDPDYTAYTIQDSYGRYIGQTDWESGNASLTTTLPAGEDYAFYLWVVDGSYGDGTTDVYNLATYFGIGYFADGNEWRLSEDTYTDATLRPFLVAADYPVEEPVVPSFEAGQYFIMDGKGKMVSPIAEGSTYGYWNVTPAVEDGDAYIGYAENVFTIAAVDGGYTIQDVYGRHHYMTTYNSFSVSKSTQSDNSHVWTITLQDDGTYAIVNTVSGKTVQFSSYGNYAPYTDVTGALPYLIKADKVAEKPSAPEEEVAKYATNVKCTTVSSAYTDGVATVNGVADVFTLKLGTSSLNGKAKVTIPAGSTEVTYYAVGWKGTSANLQFSVGGSVVSSQSIAANTGASGNAPYTMTVADSDHYTVSFGSPLEADTEVTVETTGSAYRAILFGIQAK